jgi:hypothetical protein
MTWVAEQKNGEISSGEVTNMQTEYRLHNEKAARD